MMIPSQWDGPRRAAAAVALPPGPSASAVVNTATAEMAAPRLERPAWLRTAMFAAVLLAVSWLAMWLESAAR